MKAGPNFRISNESGDLSVFMNPVRIIGTEIIKGGTDTEGVYSSLIYTYTSNSNADTSNFISSDLWINITTIFPDAWMEWMNSSARSAGLGPANYSVTSQLKDSTVFPNEYTVKINIKNIKMITISRSLVDVSLESQ